MTRYHDEEWGVAVHDDVELFERLALESFQAGLSWSTILRKREAFRRAFADRLSADLRRRGFGFVGSTIVYAMMQSVGLVDDHLPGCFRYRG